MTGVTAHDSVNVDKSKEVGSHVLTDMVGKNVMTYTFKRKAHAVTMDSKSAIAKSIWNAVPHDDSLEGDILYVLDGEVLLHRLPWQTGKTYTSILDSYCSYVSRHYGPSVIIVFDGYTNQPSTKDGTHTRRNKTVGRNVSFTSAMPLKMKKQEFLSNNDNKQRFINMLSECLERTGFQVHNADGDADVLIAQTAVMAAKKHRTVLVGDDTDLLILLLHLYQCGELYFMSEPRKSSSSSSHKYLNIGRACGILAQDVTSNILFTHAILGCDTTSRVFGVGKSVSLRLVQESPIFREQASVFRKVSATKDEIIAAGEKAMGLLCKGGVTDSLNELRLKRFHAQVTDNKTAIHPRNLPPTSSSTKFHSLRVYHQVQEWMGNSLPPEEWGWRIQDGHFIPIHSDQDPAPQFLLELVRCKCKSGCSTMRCPCRRQGLDCTLACLECRGACANMCSHHQDDSEDIE
ncbi:hypothetical protein Pcinc_016764 [Petrolisthes cinctipes]|uniref:Tesmin/TSO1-like CXC domain-containing protein n=2 Tax=Petrolisthes cinctipes TaxID=88211 RepID=A0AAE1KP86_PETCI|nr:hypothetical protein Pcinc_016764 [Petrolisthes cinctipes]